MSDNERVETLRAEIKSLKKNIHEKAERDSHPMVNEARSSPPANAIAIKNHVYRKMAGHTGPVCALQWSNDGFNVVTLGQGTNDLFLWNVVTGFIAQGVLLKSAYELTCAIEEQKGNLMACAGMNAVCAIYHMDRSLLLTEEDQDEEEPEVELRGHSGSIYSCQFVGDRNILTCSSDETCNYWDLRKNKVLNTFSDHTGVVLSASVNPTDPNMFVTGSYDTTARIWDIRSGKCTQTHYGHEEEIHRVKFFPDGSAFGTASEDSTSRIFDLRSYGELQSFETPTSSMTVDFSKSGRLLFTSCKDGMAYAYDVLSTTAVATPTTKLIDDSGGIRSLGVCPRGDVLCTGSKDGTVKIWA